MIRELKEIEMQLHHLKKERNECAFFTAKERLQRALQLKKFSLTREQKIHFKNLLNLKFEA